MKNKLHIIVEGGNPTTKAQAERIRVKYKAFYGKEYSLRMHRDCKPDDINHLSGKVIIHQL
jgi:hypothetical protein